MVKQQQVIALHAGRQNASLPLLHRPHHRTHLRAVGQVRLQTLPTALINCHNCDRHIARRKAGGRSPQRIAAGPARDVLPAIRKSAQRQLLRCHPSKPHKLQRGHSRAECNQRKQHLRPGAHSAKQLFCARARQQRQQRQHGQQVARLEHAIS